MRDDAFSVAGGTPTRSHDPSAYKPSSAIAPTSERMDLTSRGRSHVPPTPGKGATPGGDDGWHCRGAASGITSPYPWKILGV